MDHSVSATFLVPRTFATNVKWTTRAIRWRLQNFLRRRKHATVRTIVYVVVKFLDASLKLDGTVFNRFNIDLTEIEVGIRELSNDEFDRFRLGFGSSSSKKNVSFHRFHIRFLTDTVFDNLFQRFDDRLKVFFQRDVFFHFTSF